MTYSAFPLSAGLNASNTGTDWQARITIIVVGVILLTLIAVAMRWGRRRSSARRLRRNGAGQAADVQALIADDQTNPTPTG